MLGGVCCAAASCVGAGEVDFGDCGDGNMMLVVVIGKSLCIASFNRGPPCNTNTHIPRASKVHKQQLSSHIQQSVS
jgi:hypothetical protein